MQQELKGIKPLLSDLRYTVPSLFKQKQEMVAQTLDVLGSRRRFEGYVEIGSKARYYAGLAKKLDLAGPAYFIDEQPPGFSAADILERGGIAKQGVHLPLQDYEPIAAAAIADASVDLVTCYVGLHHMTAERLTPFLASVARILRPGGAFIVRDHDVASDDMRALVSLAHTVFNAGLGETWEANRAELRFFESADTWVAAPPRRRLRRPRPPPAAGQRSDAATRCSASSGAARRRPPRPAATRPCPHEPDARCDALGRGAAVVLALAAAIASAVGAAWPPTPARPAVRAEPLTAARGPAHARPDLPHLPRVVPGAQPGRVRALPVAQRAAERLSPVRPHRPVLAGLCGGQRAR